MSERGGPRCGKPVGGGFCGRPLGHNNPKCATPEAVAHGYAQSVIYHRERVRERRAKIDQIKLERKCIDCGYDKDARALDFDHQDPSLKVLDISSMMNHSWDKVLAELAKCVVRCACCHRIKTHRKPVLDPGVEDGLSG